MVMPVRYRPASHLRCEAILLPEGMNHMQAAEIAAWCGGRVVGASLLFPSSVLGVEVQPEYVDVDEADYDDETAGWTDDDFAAATVPAEIAWPSQFIVKREFDEGAEFCIVPGSDFLAEWEPE